MPWCPQCRDEYREGSTHCPKCGLPLTDQAPPPLITPWRERLPPPLRSALDHCVPAFLDRRVRAAAYGSQGWRLLRRRRVLLALPLVVAVFNAVEFGTGAYVASRYTRAGRELMAQSPEPLDARTRESRLRSRDLFPMWEAVNRLAYPVPDPLLKGASEVVLLAAAGSSPSGEISLFLSWMLLLLLSLPLEAIVLAGYYGVLWRAVTEEVVPWPSFWIYARRYALRFYLFGVLLSAVTAGPVTILVRLPAEFAIYRALSFAGWVATFALALTLVAVVADDAPLRRALRSGAAVLLRDLPVALSLLATWLVALALTALLSWLAGPALVAVLAPADPATLQLCMVPLEAVRNALLALVGTWLLIVSFLWYSDRRPAPREDPSPAAQCADGG
jgi:hypothetical protein